MKRFALVIMGLCAGLLAIAVFLQTRDVGTKPTGARSYGQALIGGSFDAVDHLGQPFTHENLLGRYSLVFFGFTYCPDICPTTLLTVAEALDVLQPAQRKQLLPVFVSVDPKRDTVEVMRQYVSSFHPQQVGLTGSEAQIDRIAKAYKAFYSVVPAAEGSQHYQVDHSGFLYLMAPDGKYLAHFPHNISAQRLAEEVRSHMLGAK